MRIFITGDVHGLTDFTKLEKFKNTMRDELTLDDYLIICGDVAIVWYDDSDDEYHKEAYTDMPCTVLFVDGNHENFAALYKYPVGNWRGGKVHLPEFDTCPQRKAVNKGKHKTKRSSLSPPGQGECNYKSESWTILCS